MDALLLTGPRQLIRATAPTPVAASGGQMLRVVVAGIGGSEYLSYLSPGMRTIPGVMGHSIAGLDDEGQRMLVFPLRGCEHCEYCAMGQLQLCDNWTLTGVQFDGGLATHCAVRNTQLVPMPDSLSWSQAVFVEPFANALNSWQRAAAQSTDSIAVIGAGSIGLGVVACAAQAGCEVICVAEPTVERQQAAHQLGATDSCVRLEQQYSVVFDTVGSPESRCWAIDHTRKGGRTVFLGFATPDMVLDMSEVIRHQKQLIGSFVYSREQFEQAITLAQCCPDDWVQYFGFDDLEAQLQRFSMGDFSCIKAAFRPE
ncbi:MAG: zinc-binding dehydrogenase [Marinobacterium sp.]|nr:zinc-binding dehydrogenase [Marinobacterium sp.]